MPYSDASHRYSRSLPPNPSSPHTRSISSRTASMSCALFMLMRSAPNLRDVDPMLARLVVHRRSRDAEARRDAVDRAPLFAQDLLDVVAFHVFQSPAA